MDPPTDDISGAVAVCPPPQPKRIRLNGSEPPAPSGTSFLSSNSSSSLVAHIAPPIHISTEDKRKLKKIKTAELHLQMIIEENERRFYNGENANDVGRRIIFKTKQYKIA